MGELQRVSQLLTDIPEIVECDRVTGEDCFVAKVFVPRIDIVPLECVIDKLIPLRADQHVDHTVVSGPSEAPVILAR